MRHLISFNVFLVLFLGWLVQPVLPIVKLCRRGWGIVRVPGHAETPALYRSVPSWAALAYLLLMVIAVSALVWPDAPSGLWLATFPPGAALGRGVAGQMPPEMVRALAQSLAGREQGPEFFQSLNWPATAGTVNQMVFRNMSINRPLDAIIIRVAFRVVIGTADYTAVAAESPTTILERVQVSGTFKGSQLTPWDISGSSLHALARCSVIRGNSVYINNVRQVDAGVPYQQQIANFGAQGSYDVEVYYTLPCAPWLPLGSKSNAEAAQNYVPYYWKPEDWGDTIQITLDMGDRTAFGTPAGGTTATFTAFGSAAGQPIVEVYTRYALLGDLRAGYRTAAVVRNEQLSQAVVTAVANNLRLAQLVKGRKMTQTIVKSGLLLAGTTAGVNVYSDLQDGLLEQTVIWLDNKFVRNNRSNRTSKESIGSIMGTVVPEGYLPFSFIDSGTVRTAFRADLPTVVGAASTYELQSNVITANAQNRVQVIQELIVAEVDDPYWAGTR